MFWSSCRGRSSAESSMAYRSSPAGKVFAFTTGGGVVLKLPAERVQVLAITREARPLIMGKRVMREWVVVALPHGLRGEAELLREAMGFVAAGGRGGKGGD